MYLINIPFFKKKLIYFEILLQTIFYYKNNVIVKFEIKKFFNQKFGQYLIK